MFQNSKTTSKKRKPSDASPASREKENTASPASEEKHVLSVGENSMTFFSEKKKKEASFNAETFLQNIKEKTEALNSQFEALENKFELIENEAEEIAIDEYPFPDEILLKKAYALYQIIQDMPSHLREKKDIIKNADAMIQAINAKRLQTPPSIQAELQECSNLLTNIFTTLEANTTYTHAGQVQEIMQSLIELYLRDQNLKMKIESELARDPGLSRWFQSQLNAYNPVELQEEKEEAPLFSQSLFGNKRIMGPPTL